MVESKSLKLYLLSFRDHETFRKDCANIIKTDLICLVTPKYIEGSGIFTLRGRISFYPFCNYGCKGTQYEELAKTHIFNHD